MSVITAVTDIFLQEEPSAELRLNSQGSSVLDPPGRSARSGDLRVARRDVASLPARQGGFFRSAPSGPAVAFRRVVNHHGGRIHAGQRVHAALTGGVEPRGA